MKGVLLALLGLYLATFVILVIFMERYLARKTQEWLERWYDRKVCDIYEREWQRDDA